MTTFADQVAGWTNKAEDRLTRVFHRAVQLLAIEMNRTEGYGGALPHVTGNLMRSMQALIGQPVMRGGADARHAGQDVGIVIAGAELGDAIYLGWQAIYAHRMNYGFVGEDKQGRNYNQVGRHFVERAVAMWPELVAKAAQEIQD